MGFSPIQETTPLARHLPQLHRSSGITSSGCRLHNRIEVFREHQSALTDSISSALNLWTTSTFSRGPRPESILKVPSPLSRSMPVKTLPVFRVSIMGAGPKVAIISAASIIGVTSFFVLSRELLRLCRWPITTSEVLDAKADVHVDRLFGNALWTIVSPVCRKLLL